MKPTLPKEAKGVVRRHPGQHKPRGAEQVAARPKLSTPPARRTTAAYKPRAVGYSGDHSPLAGGGGMAVPSTSVRVDDWGVNSAVTRRTIMLPPTTEQAFNGSADI